MFQMLRNLSTKTPSLFNSPKSIQRRCFSELDIISDRIESVKKIRTSCNSMKNIAIARKVPMSINCMEARSFCRSAEPIWKPKDEDEIKPKKYMLAILNSDMGMCGSSNHSVGSLMVDYIEKHELKPDDISFLRLGARSERYTSPFDAHNCTKALVAKYSDGKKFSVDSTIDIIEKCIYSQKWDKILFFYNHLDTATTSSSRIRSLYSKEICLKHSEQLIQYESTADLGNLYDMSLLAALQEVILESIAVEQTMRMISMTNAVKNIDEMLEELSAEFNNMRQSKVTTEICEVNAGAMALADDEEI